MGFSLFATVLLRELHRPALAPGKTPELGTSLHGPPLAFPSKWVPLPTPPDSQLLFRLQYFLFHVQISYKEGG